MTLAIHLDRAGYETAGYDIDEEKVDALGRGNDSMGEFDDSAIAESDISFTNSPESLEECDYVHLSLPTPLDESDTPDLSGLEAACETVGRHISDGTVVVFESTLYPGATREVLRPAVERGTAAQGGASFSVGYSPERIVPGGGKSFSEVTKVVSAEDDGTLDDLAELYDSIVDAGVHRAESIETAEASKCLENAQRDVNIGLVNEFTMGCRHLDFDLDPHAVLTAARTKWNFQDYRPGIVGGHCIPVDPHYLRYAFEESGFDPQALRTARATNQQMVKHVRSRTVDALCTAKAPGRIVGGPVESVGDIRTEGSLPESVAGSRVLLLGFGYKPNARDVRNSGVPELAREFEQLDLEVSGFDPFHDATSVPESYDFDVMWRLDFDGVDAVVLLAPHDEFRELDLESVADRMNDDPVFVDVGNAFDPETATADGFTYRRL
ncbi:nucleotide sugar dehydrogenase [Halostella sp. JP-L12]|nr:nucleotide sugar dehydrogenase [Halostella sp. JP-L12]